jgi:hypothetical protein
MKSTGWIKISRKLLEWEHYKDVDTFHVFMTLMLQAYPKQRTIGGKLVEAGQVLTSISRLMDATGIKSKRAIIDSLQKLISSGEITRERVGNDSVVTICKFDYYQGCINMTQPADKGCINTTQPEEQGCINMTQQVVSNRHNHTFINENNKLFSIERNIKEINTHPIKENEGAPKSGDFEAPKNEPKIGYEKFGPDGLVWLKAAEYRTLSEQFGEDVLKAAIDDLNDKIASGTEKSESHYHTLRYWLRYRKDSPRKSKTLDVDLNIMKR